MGKKADWNFMMHTCNLSGGTIPIKSCDQQGIEEAAASLATVVHTITWDQLLQQYGYM
jgi:hypothetical protein